MANQLFAKGANLIMQAGVDLSSAAIKCALVKASYTPNLASHQYYSDLSSHVLGTPLSLTGKSVANGVFDADDVTFTAPSSGQSLLAPVLFVDTGVAGTSPLLWWAPSITGFPFTTVGSDVKVIWDAAGIFKMVP